MKHELLDPPLDPQLIKAFRDGSSAPRGEECPTPERLWQAVSGELEPASFQAIVEHTAACAACAEDFRLSREMVAAASLDDDAHGSSGSETKPEGVVKPFPQPSKSRQWTVALSIAAALVLVVLSLRFQTRDPVEPIYREGGQGVIQSALTDGAELARDQALLVWSGPEGARYDLLVTTESLDPVFEAQGLDRTEYLIPAASLSELRAGTILIWQVDGRLNDGEGFSSVGFKAKLVDGNSSTEAPTKPTRGDKQ